LAFGELVIAGEPLTTLILRLESSGGADMAQFFDGGQLSLPRANAALFTNGAVATDGIVGARNIVVGDLSANSGMTLTTGVAGTSLYGFADGAGLHRASMRYNQNLDELQFVSNGAQRISLNDADAIANATEFSIGTLATANVGMTILCTGTGIIGWADVANTFRGGVRYAHGTDQLQWIAAGAQRMFLSSTLLSMTTGLAVVGDATLESDLILDAATGNGDITMAGEMDGAGGRAWGTRTNAAGGALAIGPGDAHIEFSSNGGGAVAMTETMTEGQMVTLVMTAFDTDDYTLAVGGGTLTFNAANEAATIVLDSSVVRVVGLAGATIV
jgi:hypothetical protein